MSNEMPKSKFFRQKMEELGVDITNPVPCNGTPDGDPKNDSVASKSIWDTPSSEVKKVEAGLLDSPKSVPTNYVPATDALKRIREEMAGIFEWAAAKVESGELPLIGWGLSLPRVQTLAPTHENRPWFFIGDIHGDFLALHRLLEEVRRTEGFRLCFLGDLVDRGRHHIECFAALLDAAKQFPDQVVWILGNHDEGIVFYQEKWLQPKVDPAEFVEWLNEPGDGITPAQTKTWGTLFVDVTRRLPRAMLFKDGLLATHGGIPLKDRWPTLKGFESFHHPQALTDFTWTRVAEKPTSALRKPGTSDNCEAGVMDVEGFCKAAQSFFPVKRLVRGHDHIDETGYLFQPKHKNIPVLTINGFGTRQSFRIPEGQVKWYAQKLILGVLDSREQLPRIEEVPYRPEEHEGIGGYAPMQKTTPA